jgi:hypothetical protein
MAAPLSEGTQATMRQRDVTGFWKNVQKGADASASSEARKGNSQCWQSGTFQNPIKLQADFYGALVSALFNFIGGVKRAAQVPNPMAPDPIKESAMANSIKANVKPGQWFYFSTMPDWIFLWNGDFISEAYDKKLNQYRVFNREGREAPSA